MITLSLPRWIVALLLVLSTTGAVSALALIPAIAGHPRVCGAGEPWLACVRQWAEAGGTAFAIIATLFAAILAWQAAQEQITDARRQARIRLLNDDLAAVRTIQQLIRMVRNRLVFCRIQLAITRGEFESELQFLQRYQRILGNFVEQVLTDAHAIVGVRVNENRYDDAITCADDIENLIEQKIMPDFTVAFRTVNSKIGALEHGEMVSRGALSSQEAFAEFTDSLADIERELKSQSELLANILGRIDADIISLIEEEK